jgi:hypothetical protein
MVLVLVQGSHILGGVQYLLAQQNIPHIKTTSSFYFQMKLGLNAHVCDSSTIGQTKWV